MRKEAGFSLLEILVAAAILVIIISITMPAIDHAIGMYEGFNTRADAKIIRKAMTRDYERYAMTIDTVDAAELCTNSDCSDYFTTNTTVPLNDPSSAETGWLKLASYAGLPANKIAKDGYNRPWMIYVSNLLHAPYDGYSVPYHVIAFVSVRDFGSPSTEGQNVSFNPNTGQITLPVNAHAVVINGLPIEERLYQQTLKKMHTIASAYATYFTTQYEANTDRNIGIDYFATADSYDQTNSNLWDSNSTIGNSGNGNGPGFPYPGVTGSPLTNTNVALCDVQPAEDLSGFDSTLGLSNLAVTSAWGYPIGIGNGPNSNSAQGTCYGDDRDPSSGNGNLQNPPYTAFIDAWAPGGELLAVPVIGNY